MCIFVFVFVYFSYCPGRACVFTTVGGVVVSNEQRKLLSHPVVILNTSDRILSVFVFVCVYSSVCVLVFVFAHLIFYTYVTPSGHLNTPDFRELLFIADGWRAIVPLSTFWSNISRSSVSLCQVSKIIT